MLLIYAFALIGVVSVFTFCIVCGLLALVQRAAKNDNNNICPSCRALLDAKVVIWDELVRLDD